MMFRRPNHNERDFMLYPEPHSHSGYASPPLDVDMSPDAYSIPQGVPEGFLPSAYEPVYSDAAHFMVKSRTSPRMYSDDGELRMPSNLSTASGPSAPSSTVGSPHSNPGQLAFMPEYQHTGLGVSPAIVGNGEYFHSAEYSYSGPGMEEFSMPLDSKHNFVDPSLIQPELRGPMPPQMQGYEAISPQNHYPNSPALSVTGAASPMRTDSQSPYMQSYHQYSPFGIPPQAGRRPSLSSFHSHDYVYSGDEAKEKQKCPHPDCGKTFKDLKAHMLTHQLERPEKCPIQTCDYHIKGFARKYDKNRHTLTHYKGTMVCGFCPGSGSAAEKSFNRADVFKRHLTAVHGVEQSPPNSRKKMTSTTANTGKKLTGYASDATGKCSTCSATFSNAQDFYEHLDDCVLRIVQQEDPAEAINAQRLAEVENDKEVHQTLEKNQLPLTMPQTTSTSDDEEDDEMPDGDDPLNEEFRRKKNTSPVKKKGNPPNGVQKSRGMTHSRGGVALHTKSKSRKNRRDYPSSWGFDKGQMTKKKRVIAVFDGQRRLAKDDMMLSTENEIRLQLSDGKSYVTDLDVHTLKRAEGFLNATEEEKGIWISDDPTEEQMQRMLEMSQQ
ncbi:hypothetical protein DL766_010554 [Monosporascus sp. MC13-8B]|uniref:C2H2-type domain-containing protein n=1 Tax=Monosporascus cannonballus TaxID=155416 RepID=A0ABY0H5L4_9PEZI|nr:hypothetical protein DL762_005578 [Monosporascus cannonballus]RYP00138.1 hypothetical protein DL763_001067 [Monosporascus cannonballus]RYP02061.1 hypothetical protein DL766_010554 [Monosporascus sp. MC13-8B]